MSKQLSPKSWLAVAAIALLVFLLKHFALLPEGQKSIEKSGWQVWENAHFVENRGNDGDSFYVAHQGKQHLIRLYYVDTPESRESQYPNMQKRIRDQAKALGDLTPAQTILVGKQAKQFTHQLLAQPFTVYTQNEPVYDSDRIYALVEIQYEGRKRWLHQVLIEQGFARIHTKPMPLPDGTKVNQETANLRKLEAGAKKNRRGAWGEP